MYTNELVLEVPNLSLCVRSEQAAHNHTKTPKQSSVLDSWGEYDLKEHSLIQSFLHDKEARWQLLTSDPAAKGRYWGAHKENTAYRQQQNQLTQWHLYDHV